MALRTPLYDRHRAMGARIVEFGGFDMPLQYGGIREEHLAVRGRAGLFDISHMGRVRVEGEGHEAAVQRLVANDLERIGPGRAMYAVMCRDDGGIVDDVIVSRGGGDATSIVINAACREKDIAWMRAHAGPADVVDVSEETALLAVQGPRAEAILAPLTDLDLTAMRPFAHARAEVAGATAAVSRTGYTGEDGFELLLLRAGDAPAVWDALLEAGRPDGLVPAGLGARDTLRLEAGLRLYGQDMDETVDPITAGLGWTVKLDKGDFIGAEALRRVKEDGPRRRFVGLAMEGRAIARHGHEVLHGGRPVGRVTSGTYSFTLQHGIATAYVEPEASSADTALEVDVRGTRCPARVVPLPFYRRG